MQKRMITFGLAVAMVFSVIDLAQTGPEFDGVKAKFVEAIKKQEQIMKDAEIGFARYNNDFWYKRLVSAKEKLEQVKRIAVQSLRAVKQAEDLAAKPAVVPAKPAVSAPKKPEHYTSDPYQYALNVPWIMNQWRAGKIDDKQVDKYVYDWHRDDIIGKWKAGRYTSEERDRQLGIIGLSPYKSGEETALKRRIAEAKAALHFVEQEQGTTVVKRAVPAKPEEFKAITQVVKPSVRKVVVPEMQHGEERARILQDVR
jgi:hypothetical protein